MAREARDKKLFSTYYIKQVGSVDCTLFASEADRLKFIEILKNSKKKIDFRIYAYNISDKDSYEIIIFDNGSDISSIMKSLNISYSMYKNSGGQLFKDRYKSIIIKDYFTLANYIQEIHHLGDESKWNGCQEYFKEELADSFLDIKEIKKLLHYQKVKSFEEYSYYFENTLTKDSFICDENSLFCQDVRTCIMDKEEARIKLDSILKEKSFTFEDLLKNLKVRNYWIKYFRKNSILSLREIGLLFGNLSESTICKIINNK